MNQIVPYPLWLGHADSSRDFRAMLDQGIEALVQVAMEVPAPQPPREIVCCHFPLLDGTGNRSELIYLAFSTLATLIKMRLPTLVTCDGGVSRSPAIAAAALAMVLREPPEDCLSRIVQHHPSDVSPGLWSEITRLLPSVRL